MRRWNACLIGRLVLPWMLLLATEVLVVANAQFYKTSGQDILDPQGNKFLPRGMNLNGWLVPEAYGLHLNQRHTRHFDSASQIRANIIDLIGDEAAAEFWQAYTDNYVTRQDILDLAQAGFNSVRLPFNYRLLTPQEEPGIWLEEGFQIIDKAIQWCKEAGLAILLDLHAVPGGQAHEPYADPEYLYWREEENGIWRQRGTQMIWENKTEYFEATGRDTSFNRQRTADVWWQIANRYKDETQILGYELMNEPYFYPITGVTDQDLREFYYQLVGAIRDVDQNHMVITEGNIFAIEIGGLLPPWDDNMAVAFHRLWRPTSMDEAGEMQGYLDARDQDPVPFLMTEAGENSDPWIYEMKNFLESLNMGWFFWGFKKVGMDLAMHYEIQPTEDYRYVVENWRDSPNPDRERIRRGLMDLTESIKSENCRIQPGWFASMVDPTWSQVSKPYIDMSIPGRVFAAHYDVGNNGIAYLDTRYKNEVYLGEPSNSGFVYRNGGVDISITYEELGEDHLGYHVIDMEAGEWMKYTVNVQEPGWYAVRSRVRHVEGGTTARFNLEAAPVG